VSSRPEDTIPVRPLLRDHRHGGHAPVGYMELFFDLVYVFAITQLSHNLLEHLSWIGALQTAILFFAVWWAWIYTTWATNWVDPDKAANRVMLGCVMIGSLVMSSTIPHAFENSGLAFAITYVAVQIGRTLYLARALGEWQGEPSWNMTRAAIWFAAGAVFWIVGGLWEDAGQRMVFWAAALAIEYLGPIFYFRVPGLGRSHSEDWAIAGGHMAERCALFIIIALGEGLLITGATFGKLDVSAASIAAFITAFVGSFAMWWVYFDVGAKRGAEHIEHHANPGLVGRNVFTYWHIPIVAGIVMIAVADEMTLTHPLALVHFDFLLVTTGGMALFLLGTGMFKRTSNKNNWFPLSHRIGLSLVAVLALWGWLGHPQTMPFYAGSTMTFAVVALWEWVSFHGGWLERIERRHPMFARLLRRYADWRHYGRR
jgi:low temperature requirement protein LtrA